MKNSRWIVAVMLAFASAPSAAYAKKPNAEKAPAVKKTPDQAKAIALAKVPGTIKAIELEKEHGVWLYSIEIRPAGEKNLKHIKEVNVDANTGAIIDIEDETSED
jgi:uncharacterized membrane protein YkoI